MEVQRDNIASCQEKSLVYLGKSPEESSLSASSIPKAYEAASEAGVKV